MINPVYRTKAISIAQQMLALVIIVFAESAAQWYARTGNIGASSNRPTEPDAVPGNTGPGAQLRPDPRTPTGVAALRQCRPMEANTSRQ